MIASNDSKHAELTNTETLESDASHLGMELGRSHGDTQPSTPLGTAQPPTPLTGEKGPAKKRSLSQTTLADRGLWVDALAF